MRISGVFLTGAMAACLPTPALVPLAPAPSSLRSERTVEAALESAAQLLTGAGFEILTRDAGTGVLTARRFQTQTGNAEYLRCDFPAGSLREQHLNSTLTVSLRAVPADAGSTVTIAARALSQYPGLENSPLASPDSETDCVSNGTVESRLGAALR